MSASAVLAAGYRTGRTEKELLLHALGGDLKLKLKEEGNIHLSGPAEFVFEGTVDLEHLRASLSDG